MDTDQGKDLAVREVLATGFWDSKGALLIDYLLTEGEWVQLLGLDCLS